MSPWATGQAAIQALLDDGSLEQVGPSTANAHRLLAEAALHLQSAEVLAAVDPAGAYDMLYSASRKAMAAALAAQGLRSTSKGGHIAVQEAMTHQLGRSGSVLKPFARLRRTRNEADYPRLDTPALTAADVIEDLPRSKAIVESMAKLVGHLTPWSPTD